MFPLIYWNVTIVKFSGVGMRVECNIGVFKIGDEMRTYHWKDPKCAKFLGGDPDHRKWCGKFAKYATSGSVVKDGEVDHIGHFYCEEHRPKDADVILLNVI